MTIISLSQPVETIRGDLRGRPGSPGITTSLNPHAGLIAGPTIPSPSARTPMEQTMIDIHVLTGPKHTEAGQVTGNFLKTTSATTFGFEPHGLGPTDVGALPVAGTAADSDKLDGSHAAAFEPAIAPDAGDKYFAADKTWKFLDHLCASDGTPAPALSADAAGNLTAVGNLTFGTYPSTLSTTSDGAQCRLNPAGNIFALYNPVGTPRQRIRLYYAGTATLDLYAPSAIDGPAVITTVGAGSKLNLASASTFVGINNNNPAVALDVTGAIKGSSTLTLPSMSSAGFVKNSAAGLLSGGNAIATADVPADIGHPLSSGASLMRWRGHSASPPATPLDGDTYYDTGMLKLQTYDTATGTWRPL